MNTLMIQSTFNLTFVPPYTADGREVGWYYFDLLDNPVGPFESALEAHLAEQIFDLENELVELRLDIERCSAQLADLDAPHRN
jgi:hypothetical protein